MKLLRHAKTCLLVLTTMCAVGLVGMAQPSGDIYPQLNTLKNGIAKGDKKAVASADKMKALADDFIAVKPYTVMSKTGIPPSGDKHDYLSLAPYFWPDPTKKDGMPYMRKDGEVNPQTRDNFTDYNEWNKLSDAVDALAKAYYLTDDGKYAEKAATLVDVWFIQDATRMNPNLNFAQGVRGQSDGRPFGIIEFGGIAEILQAMQLLEARNLRNETFYNAFKKWLSDYAHWLQHSPLGMQEAATKNNHGSTYDLQLLRIFDYLKENAQAKAVLEKVGERRIATQIEADGKQPEELIRTKAFSYSLLNLNSLTQLAVYGKKYGVDVWGYTTADGGSLKKAYEFLIPYLHKEWPYQQIDGVTSSRKRLADMLRFAGTEFNEPSWIAIANQYK